MGHRWAPIRNRGKGRGLRSRRLGGVITDDERGMMDDESSGSHSLSVGRPSVLPTLTLTLSRGERGPDRPSARDEKTRFTSSRFTSSIHRCSSVRHGWPKVVLEQRWGTGVYPILETRDQFDTLCGV